MVLAVIVVALAIVICAAAVLLHAVISKPTWARTWDAAVLRRRAEFFARRRGEKGA